ncbi:MAG: hypothetical protein ACXV3A_08655 [Kineosporiaceae bacterium]
MDRPGRRPCAAKASTSGTPSAIPRRPTGLLIKSRRTATAARIAYYRKGSAGSRLAVADLPVDRIRAAGVLHVTGITPALSSSARAATFAAIEEARAAAVPVSVDVNHRPTLWRDADAGPVLAELAAPSPWSRTVWSRCRRRP